MPMLKKAAFFDFLNRRSQEGFDALLGEAVEDEDYINWNDYLLPQHYGDPQAEYHAIRHSCAIFDVSPIRKFRITGPAAGMFLDHLFTRPVSTSGSMRGIYVIFCNRDGTLKDDAIGYKLGEEDYLLMPSDIDHSPHFDVLRAELGIDAAELSVIESTKEWVGIALQGPMSATALCKMGFEDIASIEPFEARHHPFPGGDIVIARMGFTADLGYECWLAPSQQAAMEERINLARKLSGMEIPGYGLGALESCRLEGGFIVAGWDFATEADPQPGFERTPYEVGLGWLVDLDAINFFGRDALISKKNLGHKHLLRTLQIRDSRKPGEAATLLAEVGGEMTAIGSINCSAWSGSLDCMVGNASIDSAYADLEAALLEIEGGLVDVLLRRGAHINQDRRNSVPATIYD